MSSDKHFQLSALASDSDAHSHVAALRFWNTRDEPPAVNTCVRGGDWWERINSGRVNDWTKVVIRRSARKRSYTLYNVLYVHTRTGINGDGPHTLWALNVVNARCCTSQTLFNTLLASWKHKTIASTVASARSCVSSLCCCVCRSNASARCWTSHTDYTVQPVARSASARCSSARRGIHRRVWKPLVKYVSEGALSRGCLSVSVPSAHIYMYSFVFELDKKLCAGEQTLRVRRGSETGL